MRSSSSFLASLLLLMLFLPGKVLAISAEVQNAARSAGLPVDFLVEAGLGTQVLRLEDKPGSLPSILKDLGQLQESEEDLWDPSKQASGDAYLVSLANAYASEINLSRIAPNADRATRKQKLAGALLELAVTRACTDPARSYPTAAFREALEDRVWLMEQVQKSQLDIPQTGRFAKILAKAVKPPKVPTAFQEGFSFFLQENAAIAKLTREVNKQEKQWVEELKKSPLHQDIETDKDFAELFAYARFHDTLDVLEFFTGCLKNGQCQEGPKLPAIAPARHWLTVLFLSKPAAAAAIPPADEPIILAAFRAAAGKVRQLSVDTNFIRLLSYISKYRIVKIPGEGVTRVLTTILLPTSANPPEALKISLDVAFKSIQNPSGLPLIRPTVSYTVAMIPLAAGAKAAVSATAAEVAKRLGWLRYITPQSVGNLTLRGAGAPVAGASVLAALITYYEDVYNAILGKKSLCKLADGIVYQNLYFDGNLDVESCDKATQVVLENLDVVGAIKVPYLPLLRSVSLDRVNKGKSLARLELAGFGNGKAEDTYILRLWNNRWTRLPELAGLEPKSASSITIEAGGNAFARALDVSTVFTPFKDGWKNVTINLNNPAGEEDSWSKNPLCYEDTSDSASERLKLYDLKEAIDAKRRARGLAPITLSCGTEKPH